MAKERRIAAARAAESGKPANIVAKMVEGAVAKFLAEVTLLGQAFVKERQGDRREDVAKAQGATINGFVLYVVGEGIEKKQGRFRCRGRGDEPGLTLKPSALVPGRFLPEPTR